MSDFNEIHFKPYTLDRILNLRLSVTMKMLKMREEQNDDIINKRLEILWKNKLEEMDKNLDLVKRINLRGTSIKV